MKTIIVSTLSLILLCPLAWTQDQKIQITCAIGEEAHTFPINPAAVQHISVIQNFIDAAGELSKQTPLNFPYNSDGEALKAIFSDDGLMRIIVDLNTDPSGAEKIVAELEKAIQTKEFTPKKVASLMITANILGIEPIINACALHIANNLSCYYCISQENECCSSSTQQITPKIDSDLPHELKAFIAQQCWNKKAYQLHESGIMGEYPDNGTLISPDGRTQASANFNNITLWDTNTNNLITTLAGHSDLITSLSFSSDGHTLATRFRDNTIQLWRMPGTSESFVRKPEHELDSILAEPLKTLIRLKKKRDADKNAPASKRLCNREI